MIVKNLENLERGKTAKITAVAYAKCTKRDDTGVTIKLYSYNTLIAVFERNEFFVPDIAFTPYYDYSATTMKHLHDFLKSLWADLPIPEIRKALLHCDNYFLKNGFGYRLVDYDAAEKL